MALHESLMKGHTDSTVCDEGLFFFSFFLKILRGVSYDFPLVSKRVVFGERSNRNFTLLRISRWCFAVVCFSSLMTYFSLWPSSVQGLRREQPLKGLNDCEWIRLLLSSSTSPSLEEHHRPQDGWLTAGHGLGCPSGSDVPGWAAS